MDTYTEISGGTVLGTTANDDQVFNNSTTAQTAPITNTGFPIGFNFEYNGTTYDKFAVNTNGWIKLGTGSFEIGGATTPLSSTTTSVSNALSGMGTDLIGQDGSEISYLTTGTAPNRQLIVQWKGYKRYLATTANINFQIILTETSNTITYSYGVNTISSSYSAQVGLKGANSNFPASINNRTSSTDWSATTAGTSNSSNISFTATVAPSSGLKFTFTPPAPCSGTPVAGTVTGNLVRYICSGSTPSAIAVTGTTPVYPGISYQWEQSLNGTDWTDVAAGTGATTLSYTPPAFDGTTIQYRLKVTCANSSETVYADAVTIDNQTTPTTQVTALTATPSLTTAPISWTNGNGGRRLVIFSSSPITDPVSENGIPAYTAAALYANAGQQIVYDGTGTSVTVTGLSCNTPYYVKVYEYNRCGSGPYDVYINTTSDTNAATVTTLQPATASLPTANNFTGFTGANLDTAVPGWYEAAISAASGTVPSSSNPSGTSSAWTNSTALGATTAKVNLYFDNTNAWIISPKMEITANSRLIFDAAITAFNNSSVDPERMQDTDDAVNVMVSTDGCGAVWTPIYTFNAGNTVDLTNVLTEYELLLTDYIGQTIQIAFQATDGPVNDTPDYDFHIGNILVEEIPECDVPALMATTNITKNTATIAWEAPSTGTPTGYEYIVSDVNEVPVIAGTATTALTAGVAGLTPSTDYFVFVRTVCGSSFSEWTVAGTFTTLCDYAELLTTTPGTVCGLGEAELAATTEDGGFISWYDAPVGGDVLATGTTFTTPTIDATTTYYASANEFPVINAVIGTATTLTGAIEQPTAFCNRWTSYWSQTIYTADELTAAGLVAGEINSIAYNIATLGDAATNANFIVKIASTTDSNFANTTFLTPAFTTVYGPQTYTHTASGWQQITFATPYEWDGVSNLIIEVRHSGANSTNNAQTYYTQTTDNTSIFTTNFGGSTTTGTLTNKRLNIKINQEGCPSPRVAVTATVTDAPEITVTDAVTICAGEDTEISVSSDNTDYTYNWMPGNLDGATQTVTPAETTTYTVTATDAVSGCVAVGTVTVTVNALPAGVSFNPATVAVCEGGIEALTVNGGQIIEDAVLGTGTTAPSTTEHPNPFSAWFGGHKTQMMFTASELEAQGMIPGAEITSLSFDFAASVANTLNDMKIRIGATSNVDMAGGFAPVSTLTTVYNASYTPTSGTTGLVAFNLTTPYIWDGSDIIVEVIHNQGNSGNGTGTRTRTTTTDFVSVYYHTRDGMAPAGVDTYDAIALAGNLAGGLHAIGSSSKRPNVVFTFNLENEVEWSPMEGLYTDAEATVPYNGESLATVYIMPDAAATYTATVTNDAGCSVSATVDVTISVVTAPTVDNTDITLCNGITFAELMANGEGLQWYADATGGEPLAGDTAVTEGTYYASQTVDGCESITRTALNVTIYTMETPAVTVVHPGCDETTGSITFTAPIADNFVYSIDGGVNFQASPEFLSLTPGDYNPIVKNEDNDCTVALETETVNPAPPVPAVPVLAVTQPGCGQTTGIIDVVEPIDDDFTYSINGIDFQPSSAFFDVTPGVYTLTIMNSSGCTSVDEITINPGVVVAAPTVDNTDVTICNAGTVADLVANGDNIQWYADETGGTALTEDTVLVDGTYYASQTVDDCESTARTAVTVTINVVAAPTVDNTDVTLCNAGTVADLVANGDNIQWYADETGGTALTDDTALADATYYASQTVDGCESTVRTAVTVAINVVAAPTVDDADVAICNAGTVADLVANGDNIQWYADETGGTALTDDTALVTGTYYASQTVDGCESIARAAVAVTISVVAAPTGEANQTITVENLADATIEDIEVTAEDGAVVTWYASEEDALAGENPLTADTQLTDGATYYATQTINGCEGNTVLAVTVGVVLGRNDFDIKAFSYYPNPVQDVLNISYDKEITSVAVYNLLGQQVMANTPNTTDVKLDMSVLSDGTYIITVTAGDVVKTIKVVKKQ
ncbi:T9SS type A sorting domain-containing protein [Flavobacterium salilacus subsp. salilacus]|uniref:Ig-like domain-containing protein n=1 Tax=Flavobacterium TaxID=237 RepID=UPI0013C31D75|nr:MULTISPECIES: T9SS type A sorting domain-containing protein [Flavobacterium]KAF2517505.1 T9SS type A sorting domain-containing protein [Flavobacterium salilacus subsp. salilacus]MBE1615653.1 T9SS type A sorting domain-containing protein [Flavobacterium sp. SaA2.13]